MSSNRHMTVSSSLFNGACGTWQKLQQLGLEDGSEGVRALPWREFIGVVIISSLSLSLQVAWLALGKLLCHGLLLVASAGLRSKAMGPTHDRLKSPNPRAKIKYYFI